VDRLKSFYGSVNLVYFCCARLQAGILAIPECSPEGERYNPR